MFPNKKGHPPEVLKKGGPHQKPTKSQRKKDKDSLKKTMKDTEKERDS